MNGVPARFVQLGNYLVNPARIGFLRFYPEAELNGKMPTPQLLIDFCMGSYGSTGENGTIDTASLQFYGEEAKQVWDQLARLAY